jgi:hypothetical protein
MIVLGPDGMNGDVSTPMSLSERLFSQGLVTQRGLTGRLNQAVTFVENGDINISADAVASPKTNNIIADYVARAAYIYNEQDLPEVMSRVDAVLAECNRLYWKRFRKANGFEANGEKAKVIDVLIETVPRVSRDEFLMFIDRHDLVIESDLAFKGKQDDLLQEVITNQMQGIKSVPRLCQIGYGLMRDGWKKMTRPNTYVRIGPKTVLRATRTKNAFIKSEWQVQAFYAYLLAEALRRWLGKATPAYELRDWVAVANVLIGWISGYGSTDRDQNWEATDIEVSLNNVPGLGWTRANRFLWGNVNTEEDFKMYWMTMNLLGFVSERVKAVTADYKIKTVLTNNDWQVPMRMKRAMQPNIEGWGSQGSYYMLMPRNNFSFGEKVDVPMPCIVDESTFDDQHTLLKRANNYEDLLPYEVTSWKDVTIDRGEVPQGTISETGNDAQFMRLHATTDARIVEFQDTTTRFVRRLIQWRFPMDDVVDNGMDRESRLRLWLWGLFANGDKGMKNAYVIDSSLEVFKPMIVNYRRGPMDTMVVDKEGTQTTGEQVPKPGTLSSPQNVKSNTEIATTIEPPKPVPKVPEPTKVVETKDGAEMKEDSVSEVSSETSSESNNQPEEN